VIELDVGHPRRSESDEAGVSEAFTQQTRTQHSIPRVWTQFAVVGLQGLENDDQYRNARISIISKLVPQRKSGFLSAVSFACPCPVPAQFRKQKSSLVRAGSCVERSDKSSF
jgi:hypothetical protein